MLRILPTTLFAVLTIAASQSRAADWTQYRGAQGDGVSAEVILSTDWKAKPPKVLWKSPTPLGFSSMAVADGRAFTIVAREAAGGEKLEFCIALNAETGKEIWAVPLNASDYGHDGGNAGARDNKGGDGPRSTPTVDGNLVFVYDSHMVLTCLNATDGSVVWKHDVVGEFEGRKIKWLNATSPILAGDAVCVGGGGSGQTFLAFNRNNGELIWKSGDETITHATPRLAEIGGTQQMIFFAQSGLVSLTPGDGKELWRAEFPFSVSTAASPVVAGNRVFCSAGYSVGSQVVEVSANQKVEKLWFQKNKLMNHWSTPVAHNGYLYGIFEFKKYGHAPLQCVEIETGEIKWSTRGFGPGNCILVGDKLVVLSDAGEVVLVSATPEKYEELGRVKAIEGKCWSTPAFSNGRIYVRSTEEAACLVVN